jgi:hypothetical protein
MQTTPEGNVRVGIMGVAAREDPYKGQSRDDSRWLALFGPNADPELATKLFREDFAEYRRLKNLADFQQGKRNRR